MEVTRADLADELAAELAAIRDRLSEKVDHLDMEWDELSRAEQHAAGSIQGAVQKLRLAIEELDEE